jgi:hypothetical protein
MSGSTRGGLRRAVRRFLLGSGPLKRGSDRLQVAGRLLVVLSLLAAVPLACFVAGMTRSRLEATAAAQAAERHETRAVVTQERPVGPAQAGDSSASSIVVRAEVRWHGPRDTVKQATLIVPAATGIGGTVPVWTDRSGNLTIAPADRTTIGYNAMVAGLAIAVGIPLTVWALHCALCLALDAHRARRWAEDWARVEREWRAHSG